mmetsp:Transcript_56266/g.64227  ORF Transcript_56266/g.64227 Transcript_56266/m.64227 type:complete len:242 (+) Transcript_56266:59-784(+)
MSSLKKNKDSDSEVDESLEDDMYIVEKVLAKKKQRNRTYYKIKWQNFPISECTWEPIDNLENVRGLIDEFEKNFSKTPVASSEKKKKKGPRTTARMSTNGPSYKRMKLSLDEMQGEDEDENEEEEPVLEEEKEEKETVPKEEPAVSSEGEEEEQEDKKKMSAMSPAVAQVNVRGSFAQDKPKCITGARKEKDTVLCAVEWYPREDGIQPDLTIYSNQTLRKKCPELLLDFYEARLKFPSNN